MQLPATQYIAHGFYPDLGWGYISEDLTCIEASASAVMEWLDDPLHEGTEYRVERIDRCHTTNMIESARDVSEEVAAIIAACEAEDKRLTQEWGDAHEYPTDADDLHEERREAAAWAAE